MQNDIGYKFTRHPAAVPFAHTHHLNLPQETTHPHLPFISHSIAINFHLCSSIQPLILRTVNKNKEHIKRKLCEIKIKEKTETETVTVITTANNNNSNDDGD